MTEHDDESSFFWAGLADHRVLLQRCTDCGRHRFPPMPSCPWCGATGSDVADSPAEGEIYSWVTVHHAFDARWAADVPYTIAVVELRERCRVFGRLDVEPGVVAPGLRVRPRFVDHDDWTELRFTSAEGSS